MMLGMALDTLPVVMMLGMMMAILWVVSR